MIILLYLIVILGWALLILVIKCRKAREKRIALAQQEAQIENSVHVIQIGNTFYDVIPITNPSSSVTHCHHHSHCRRGYHMRHCDSNSSLNANSHTNPTFVMDEGVFPGGELIKGCLISQNLRQFILAPAAGLEAPPSYDEVIRLPNQYPKLNNSTAVTVSENPPPTIAEIEANGDSVTTITSLSPAVITSQQRNSANRTSAT